MQENHDDEQNINVLSKDRIQPALVQLSLTHLSLISALLKALNSYKGLSLNF